MQPKRITILDDHEELVEVLTELLETAGYEVAALTGPLTSLDEVAATRPDLIILDLIFPGDQRQMTGWEYLRLIRSHDQLRSTPVLICSADVVMLRSRGRELASDPATSTLEKPFTIEAAEEAVSVLLGATRAPTWDDETDLVLIANADSRLVDASGRALRTLGLTIDELRNCHVADIVAETREWTDAEWERYRRDGHWEGPVRMRGPNDAALPAFAVADVLVDAHTQWHISRLTITEADGSSP